MSGTPLERAEAAVAHYIEVRDTRAPSDIDIEAGTNDAPWWLDLREAFDGVHDAWRAVAAEMQNRLDQRAVDLGAFTQASLVRTKALEARIHELEMVVAAGLVAFQLTREYVGEDVLPAMDGWSHHDWNVRAEAALRPVPAP